MFKILLAEDDKNLNRLIRKKLEQFGHLVLSCFDGEQALQAFKTENTDLLITDIMMPNLSGNELVKEIKSLKNDFPVIILTALDNISHKIVGFSNGADDYLTKPVDYEELNLRIVALLRRCHLVNKKCISHKEISLNFDEKSLTINSLNVELTKKEFMLLYMLASSPSRIFSRLQILDEVWGYNSESLERTVDVHINKLREKTENSSLEIATVRGLGYKAVFK